MRGAFGTNKELSETTVSKLPPGITTFPESSWLTVSQLMGIWNKQVWCHESSYFSIPRLRSIPDKKWTWQDQESGIRKSVPGRDKGSFKTSMMSWGARDGKFRSVDLLCYGSWSHSSLSTAQQEKVHTFSSLGWRLKLLWEKLFLFLGYCQMESCLRPLASYCSGQTQCVTMESSSGLCRRGVWFVCSKDRLLSLTLMLIRGGKWEFFWCVS